MMANAVLTVVFGLLSLVATATLTVSTPRPPSDAALDAQACGADRFEDINLLAINVNDPSQSIVNSSDACCELCDAELRECRAWAWHQPTGKCALKKSLGAKYPGRGYESGRILGKNETRPIPGANPFLICDGCTTASGNVDFTRDCFGQPNSRMTGANHRAGKKSSKLDCCEECLNTISCFGWTWKRASQVCRLALSSPGSVKRASGHFSGVVGSLVLRTFG